MFDSNKMTQKNKKNRNKFKENFIFELQRSHLLDDGVRDYWIYNTDQLPEPLLKNLYQVVKSKNDKVEQCIRVALDNDPDHQFLKELKEKVKEIKKGSLALEEAQTSDAEGLLEEQLKDM